MLVIYVRIRHFLSSNQVSVSTRMEFLEQGYFVILLLSWSWIFWATAELLRYQLEFLLSRVLMMGSEENWHYIQLIVSRFTITPVFISKTRYWNHWNFSAVIRMNNKVLSCVCSEQSAWIKRPRCHFSVQSFSMFGVSNMRSCTKDLRTTAQLSKLRV